MGAPVGNTNARSAKLFQQALKRALARKTENSVDAGLDKGAEKLVDAFFAGEQWAIKEVGDRIDGKPAQQVVLNGDEEGGPVQMQGVLKLVKPNE